jgi:hypothetical protein
MLGEYRVELVMLSMPCLFDSIQQPTLTGT